MECRDVGIVLILDFPRPLLIVMLLSAMRLPLGVHSETLQAPLFVALRPIGVPFFEPFPKRYT